METMTNLHNLAPCWLCSVRMAEPGKAVCIMCSAVAIPAMVEEVTQ